MVRAAGGKGEAACLEAEAAVVVGVEGVGFGSLAMKDSCCFKVWTVEA